MKNKNDEVELCPICVDPIKYYGVGTCNHAVCHICSLRLRALYKKIECTLCKVIKVNQTVCDQVVFTSDQKPFEHYRLNSMKKEKYQIYSEDPIVHKEIQNLLSFHCPEPSCDVVCSGGWSDLSSHVKKSHKKVLCDVCLSHKKQFPHEAVLYTAESVKKHKKTGDTDTSFKGHPNCGFCNNYYYSYDELYDHCKQSHEQCFLCQRDGIRDQYFVNYESLLDHFNAEHYVCEEKECLDQKFVVFGSDIDLQGHQLEKHTSSKKKGKGRAINIDFNYVGGPSGHGPKKGKGKKPDFDGESSNRRKAPDSFGSKLTATEQITNTQSIEDDFPSFKPKPQVGLSRVELYEPTPMESKSDGLFLTVAQNDIFQKGGPELMSSIKKLFTTEDVLKYLKMLTWSYKQNTITTEKYFQEFLNLSLACNPTRNQKKLASEQGVIWHRIADTFESDPLYSKIYSDLVKKQKRKGLSLKEFEMMQLGEPKRESLIRIWSDHKAKMKQQEVESLPRKQGWGSGPIVPERSLSVQNKQSKTRVLEVGVKNNVVGTSQLTNSIPKPVFSQEPSPVSSPRLRPFSSEQSSSSIVHEAAPNKNLKDFPKMDNADFPTLKVDKKKEKPKGRVLVIGRKK